MLPLELKLECSIYLVLKHDDPAYASTKPAIQHIPALREGL
jgi:hypothetical protein